MPLRLPHFRWIALLLCVLFCGGAVFGQVTTITGKVYSPLGAPPTGTGDPIPNILVYVAQTPVQPFPGVGPGTDCQNQYGIVSGSPLVEALTAADGSFTLSSPNMPNPATIVIQAGKWRRQYPNTQLTIGGSTTLNMAMPAQSGTLADGTIADLPHIAVVTGSADAIECIFPQIGISSSEVTDPSGTGSINLYKGTGTTTSGGAVVSSSSPTEATLMETPSLLQSYDLVMFGCQGTATDGLITDDPTTKVLENLLNYTTDGGRVFATHFEYNWLDSATTFKSVANWTGTTQSLSTSGNTETPATINNSPTFPEGVTLAAWMKDIGALASNPPPVVDLTNVRANTSAVYAPATSWVNLNADAALYSGTPSMQFTFDTPIGAAGIPTVAIAYSGSSTQFLLGDSADTVTVNVTNNSAADTDNTLTLAITLPPGLTAVSAVDASGGTWTCAVATPTISCSRTASLYANTSDNVTVVFSIATTATLGQATITSTLAGGGLSNSGQCGRVLYNDYHVEPPNSGTIFPKECPTQTTLSNTQKFLEYSLYNLSNFVAPTTSDIITIQSSTVTTLTDIVTPIYYGQIIADIAVETATGEYGAVDGGNINFLIDGVVVCVLSATSAGACPPPTGNTYPGVYNAGPHTIQSVYAGDANFVTSSTPLYTVTVLPDPTATSAASSLNPSTTRQAVTFTATITDAYAPAAGTVAFFDGGIQIGTGTVNSSTNTATFAVPILVPGIHNITACLVQSVDYLPSCSAVVSQIVTLPVVPSSTVTLLTSNVNPSLVGQAVTFTASVATTGAFPSTPTGTVSFLDGSTPIGAGTLNATGTASFTTTQLALGTHPITAVYAGTTELSTSTSAVYSQVVNLPLVSAGSGFIMTVAPTTVSVGVGAGVSVSVNILELNNFLQPVQLACSNLPAEMTCSFAQPLMPVSGGTTELTILPAAPHDCNANSPYFVAGGNDGLALGLLGVTGLVMFLARKRRRLLQGITLVAALCLMPVLNGCGANCTDFGVKPGNYTFTVTGTSTGSPVQTQTQTMKVTVHI